MRKKYITQEELEHPDIYGAIVGKCDICGEYKCVSLYQKKLLCYTCKINTKRENNTLRGDSMYQDYQDVCPQCGHELLHSMICTYPPIEVDECPNCQWRKERKHLLKTTLQEDKEHQTKMKSMADVEKILLSHGLGSVSGVTVMKIIDAIIESQLVDINLLRTNLMDTGLDHIQMDDGIEIIQVIDEMQ